MCSKMVQNDPKMSKIVQKGGHNMIFLEPQSEDGKNVLPFYEFSPQAAKVKLSESKIGRVLLRFTGLGRTLKFIVCRGAGGRSALETHDDQGPGTRDASCRRHYHCHYGPTQVSCLGSYLPFCLLESLSILTSNAYLTYVCLFSFDIP